jgi:hypothetical protein
MNTTIFKSIDLSNVGPAEDTKVIRLFAAIEHQGNPKNGPKDEHKHAGGGPRLPRGKGSYPRP